MVDEEPSVVLLCLLLLVERARRADKFPEPALETGPGRCGVAGISLLPRGRRMAGVVTSSSPATTRL
jgi:hypothetical protein